MRHKLLVTIAAAAVLLAAFSPFHNRRAIEISARDVNLNARRPGMLASPAPRVSGRTTTEGSHFASIRASAANGETVIASGDLDPPMQSLDMNTNGPGGGQDPGSTKTRPTSIERGNV